MFSSHASLTSENGSNIYNREKYETYWRVQPNKKHLINQAKKSGGNFIYGLCIAFDDTLKMEGTEEEKSLILREQLLAILYDLNEKTNENNNGFLILHFNPQNPSAVEKWVESNKDLLIHPFFAGKIFCVNNSDELFDEKLIHDYKIDENHVIPEYRKKFSDWTNVEKVLIQIIEDDQELHNKVLDDCKRIAEKNAPKFQSEEESKEHAKKTLITELVELCYFSSNEKTNLLLSKHAKLFSSFEYLRLKYGEMIGLSKGGLIHCPFDIVEQKRKPNTLNLSFTKPAIIPSAEQPEAIKPPAMKKDDLNIQGSHSQSPTCFPTRQSPAPSPICSPERRSSPTKQYLQTAPMAIPARISPSSSNPNIPPVELLFETALSTLARKVDATYLALFAYKFAELHTNSQTLSSQNSPSYSSGIPASSNQPPISKPVPTSTISVPQIQQKNNQQLTQNTIPLSTSPESKKSILTTPSSFFPSPKRLPGIPRSKSLEDISHYKKSLGSMSH